MPIRLVLIATVILLATASAWGRYAETEQLKVQLISDTDSVQPGTLIYNGAIDDQPTPDPASVAGATNYVSRALAEAMAGKPVSVPTSRPYGCSVKYAD